MARQNYIFGSRGMNFHKNSGRKKQPKDKVFGRIFLGHQGPRRQDITEINFMQVAFVCCFRQGVSGRDVPGFGSDPDLEKLYARKLWANFLSFPQK